jgi:hypothetical protein
MQCKFAKNYFCDMRSYRSRGKLYQSSQKTQYNANFKLDQSRCSLFTTVRHIFEISEDDHPRIVISHARDHWRTLDFAKAFVSPGVNSLGELVPSHGASRRRARG